MMEFHVSRQARDRYLFDKTLFSFTGNVIFANLAASREFAQRMNEVRDVREDPSRVIRPAALYAMGLIDELSHALIEFYRRRIDPPVMRDALHWFEARLGRSALDQALLAFVNQFPTANVYQGEKSSLEWLQGSTNQVSHREMAFEEMMLLWLANANPAFAPFSELFSDSDLATATAYREIMKGLGEFFAARPAVAPGQGNLIDMLRAPALASPESLSGQLAFIQAKWVPLLGLSLDRLLLALDVLREEDIAIWMRFHPPSARAGGDRWRLRDSEVATFTGLAEEYENYSPDQAWMPTTVLIAKSTYVWLEQISRQYGRHIHRLDQIPNEELALLRRRGMNSLWLIGIWERSRASETIKKLCGNQDAVASAYSISRYSIAEDLGGEAAYSDLRDRAYAHGIRLASDMVPNHMGIDSPWVLEHPEWFISRSDVPYPAYRYDGPDLSGDGRIEIKIEDHYYEQTDAAVVFRYRDKWSGSTRYIYHGNDGTSFPWNDTAQLDYLNPAAREQVIQTILEVARRFPIIRFDAAMTLAKRHFQRLWFPLPGTGGAIPSRAESSIPNAQFDAAMPHEFWREVVDRVAREVPGTLLLAEAFWLMEGYFVRTLGMHRVYNSAFMIMLRDEDNAKYRSVIKNTIEFDPDILKRYVNFMSNPDERTAVDQFGNGDKYFGVATLMATLPGLPMFGHGQMEGFTEKYGMEYRRARYQEIPDRFMIERHEREIAPLLTRRWLFAESRDFLLYDFYRRDGSVDENVFAYSNRHHDQRALIIYNNRYGETSGSIHHSVPYADKGAGRSRQRSIGEAFGFSGEGNVVLAFRDARTSLEHLVRSSRIGSEGLSIDLHAYQCHVFLDWRELRSGEHHRWDRLCDSLNGRGVESVEEALIALELAPLHEALAPLLKPDLLHALAKLASEAEVARIAKEPTAANPEFLRDLEESSTRFFAEAHRVYAKKMGLGDSLQANPMELSLALRELVCAAVRLPRLEAEFSAPWPADARAVLPSDSPRVTATVVWGPVLAWCVLHTLARSIRPGESGSGDSVPADSGAVALSLFEQLRLREPLARAFTRLGIQDQDGWRSAARVRAIFLARSETIAQSPKAPVAGYPRSFWQDPDVHWLIDLHEAAGHLYFCQELHEQLLWWIQLPGLVGIAGKAIATPALGTASDGANKRAAPAQRAGEKPSPRSPHARDLEIEAMEIQLQRALAEAQRAGYRVDKLLV
jgi:glycosidase